MAVYGVRGSALGWDGATPCGMVMGLGEVTREGRRGGGEEGRETEA